MKTGEVKRKKQSLRKKSKEEGGSWTAPTEQINDSMGAISYKSSMSVIVCKNEVIRTD
jgi:hypothetical protein